MVGLVDITPAAETVKVGSDKVEVYGVSAKGIGHLLARFPELRRLMSGLDVDADRLMEAGGDAVAAIIAAGCGYPGDEKAEAVAGRLTIEGQADLLAAILRLTIPKGMASLVEKLAAMGGALDLGDDLSTKAPATKSPKPSNSSAPQGTASPTPST